MNNKTVQTIAKQLREASTSKITCTPIREIIGTEDIEIAYAIQQVNIDKRLAKGARVVGRKIGLTSFAVQKQFGITQPDFGSLLDTMEVWNGGSIDVSEIMQPKVEAEIAFVLKKDLPSPTTCTADVLSAIDYVLASIEIVGSRIQNWDIRITDTVADNASANHFVLGHKTVSLENVDLINCKMKLTKNGELASSGQGSACLGSPINAMIWLARTLAKLGTPLQAGDLVLSGAIGPIVNVVAGDEVQVSIEGLGDVSVSFT